MSDNAAIDALETGALINKTEEISDDVTNSDSQLLQERHVYKPFLYPCAMLYLVLTNAKARINTFWQRSQNKVE